MPATVTLGTTTLSVPVGVSETQIKVASISGILPGYRLWIGEELMAVQGFGVETYVNVRRGVDGTASAPHASSATVYIGQAHQFYSTDPVGLPNDAIPVSPYINVLNGKLWFARGDPQPDGNSHRWWEAQTTTRAVGALGVVTTTLDPTEST